MASTQESPTNNITKIELVPGAPPFHKNLHVDYITSLGETLDAKTSYEGAVTEHLRMSGVYWSLTALSILESESSVDNLMKLKSDVVDWVFSCFHSQSGGFGGNKGHEGHLLYTLSAIQILALADSLQDERLLKVRPDILGFVSSLQKSDGSFAGDKWGEIDTRFTYCALSTLSLLGALKDSETTVDVKKAAKYILRCRNLDGGFGSCVGAESHAGQVFCCIGALAIAESLDLLSEKDPLCSLLGWWLAERQVDSGGLNGRPEKQADVCYSWWILSALSIIGKVSWINGDQLARYILKCQDDVDGGIADRPDDMADVFHTFFGIAGLSLLGHLHKDETSIYRSIDPVYALPTDVVLKLGLQGQVIAPKMDCLDPRLSNYKIIITDV